MPNQRGRPSILYNDRPGYIYYNDSWAGARCAGGGALSYSSADCYVLSLSQLTASSVLSVCLSVCAELNQTLNERGCRLQATAIKDPIISCTFIECTPPNGQESTCNKTCQPLGSKSLIDYHLPGAALFEIE